MCLADGKSYGTCLNCASTGTGGAGGVAGSAGTAGTGGTTCQCVPGAQIDCACGGNVLGFQVCKSDCTGFDLCTCPDAGGTGGVGGTGGTAGSAGTAGTGGTGVNCIPGLQSECACGGYKGYQVCKDDGSGFDTCVCGTGGTGGVGGTGGSAGAAGTGGAPPLCVPGQQIACACGGGINGTQVCVADGMSYGTCVCGTGGTGGAGGTGGTAGSAGTAGTGGGTLCAPGTQIDCACGGNGTGKQTCAQDGMSYGSCLCTVLTCHDGEYCKGTGYSFAPCEVCHEVLNGADRYVSCQQGFMVLDSINFDPTCHPDAGTVANDCEALGVIGKTAVIVDVPPAYTPPAIPANQVLGVTGTSNWYIADAGTDKPYEVWGQAQQSGDKHLMVLPLNDTAGVEFQFEVGYAPAGNTTTSDWNYLCTPVCPTGLKITVCNSKNLLGMLEGGSYTGKCHGAAGPYAWGTKCTY
ncbi:MAG: hypothetical protein WC750_00860 [Patescibacteria group bacterium]